MYLLPQVKVERLYVGNFMTALDMSGVSLSLLQLDDDRLQRLDAPTQARTTFTVLRYTSFFIPSHRGLPRVTSSACGWQTQQGSAGAGYMHVEPAHLTAAAVVAPPTCGCPSCSVPHCRRRPELLPRVPAMLMFLFPAAACAAGTWL